MPSFCSQLSALFKKNFIVMKRNVFATFAELLFPILLMFIVVGVRKAFKIENYYYTDDTPLDFAVNKTLAVLTPADILALRDVEWNGMYLKPFLNICSRRPYIALVGTSFPTEIEQQISAYSRVLDSIKPIQFEFKRYNTIEELERYVQSNEFNSGGDNAGICFGVYFEEISPEHFNYSLHFFDSVLDSGISDIPSNRFGPLNEFQIYPDMSNYQRFIFSGYFQMMKIVNDYILQKVTGTNSAKINFGMMPQKYELYKNDPFGLFLGFLFPFFVVIAYICPLCIYVFRMVNEKETRSKEGMKIMGMNEATYFLSYFIQYFITNTLYAVVNSAIVLLLLPHIPYEYIFTMYFLYGLDVFALAYFLQSFIDKTRIAMILSLLVYFVMFFLSIAVFDANVPKGLKIFMTIFPPVGIELGVSVFGYYETNFKYYHASKLNVDYANYNLEVMYIMLFVDLFIYLFLGYYLQNVVSHQYGIKRPFYFLCTKSYWCKKPSKTKQSTLSENKNSKNEEIDAMISQTSHENFQSEAIYQNKNNTSNVLKILNIKKTFDDKKTAVDGVSLNLYKDEIFALLGHNGAGKSTLISMLSGLMKPQPVKHIIMERIY